MQSSMPCSLPDRRFMDTPFKKVELKDRELLEGYLKQKTYRSCELAFPNIYLWSRKYPTEFAIVEDTLVFRSYTEEKKASVTFTAGEKGQIRKAMGRIIQWFEEQNL